MPDRDLVIVAHREAGHTVRGSVLLGETRDGRTPWLATIVAPAAAPVRLPRSMILLVDRSGSMAGPKWAAAEWAVRSLIAGCQEDDSLEVLAFDTVIERSSPGLLPMDTPARAAAVDWIRGIEPRGGTALGPGLEEALRTRPRPGTQPELLIVTDGQVSDAARVLALVDETTWRVSVLCIDSAPNAALVTTLAERGGGESWFLTSGAAGEEITDAVDRVTALFATPAVGDLVLRAPAPGHAFGRRGREGGGGLSVEIGALPAGAMRLVAGWTEGEPAGFRLEGGATVGLDVVPGRDPAVNALVAAAEIRVLEQAMRLAGWGGSADLALAEAARAGVDPTSLPAGTSVYPPIPGSHQDDPLAGALRALVVERSLAGGVVSSLTAFVGVRSKTGEVSGERVEVPSALPAGWDESFAVMASPKMMYPAAPSSSGGMADAAQVDAVLDDPPPGRFGARRTLDRPGSLPAARPTCQPDAGPADRGAPPRRRRPAGRGHPPGAGRRVDRDPRHRHARRHGGRLPGHLGPRPHPTAPARPPRRPARSRRAAGPPALRRRRHDGDRPRGRHPVRGRPRRRAGRRMRRADASCPYWRPRASPLSSATPSGGRVKHAPTGGRGRRGRSGRRRRPGGRSGGGGPGGR